MKKSILLSLSVLLSFPLLAQFKGKMVFKTMDKERHFAVYSCDAGYRYEFNEDGQEGVIIAKTGSGDIYILMPQQKMAMKSSATNPTSMGNDPVASYLYHLELGTLKVEGTETINGIKCTRAGLYNKENLNQKMYTVWTSEKYDFPIKLINHIDGSGDSSVMELKDIEPWTPNADSFEVPVGYQVMDMPAGMPRK